MARGGGDAHLCHASLRGPRPCQCVPLHRVLLDAALSCPPGESGQGSGCCGVSPTVGCHPLWDVTCCRVSVSEVPLRRGSCRALKDSPPAPLQQQKLQSWSEGSHLLCAEVLLQLCHSCARCTEAQPPAGVVSCLLHYSSLAQRLGRVLLGAAGAPGHPQGGRFPAPLLRLGAFGCRVLVGRSVACGGLCAGGAWGTGGGNAPKVIEASSGSGMSPVLLRKSTIQQNTPLPPQTLNPSRSDALSTSCTWVKRRNGSDLAPSPSTEPGSPNPSGQALVPRLPGAGPKPQCPRFCRARTRPSPPVSPAIAAAVSQHWLHCIAAGSPGSAPLCHAAPGAAWSRGRREDI